MSARRAARLVRSIALLALLIVTIPVIIGALTTPPRALTDAAWEQGKADAYAAMMADR